MALITMTTSVCSLAVITLSPWFWRSDPMGVVIFLSPVNAAWIGPIESIFNVISSHTYTLTTRSCDRINSCSEISGIVLGKQVWTLDICRVAELRNLHSSVTAFTHQLSFSTKTIHKKFSISNALRSSCLLTTKKQLKTPKLHSLIICRPL